MGIDRIVGNDAGGDKAESTSSSDRPQPPPDQPGLEPEGVPSRLESRKVAATAKESSWENDDRLAVTDSQAGETITDQSGESSQQNGKQTPQDGLDMESDESPRQTPETNDQTEQPDSSPDGQAEGDHSRRISGEGLLPDDNPQAANVDDDAVEQSLSDWLKQTFTKSDRGDHSVEQAAVVDRPDFRDPQVDPNAVPDRYGTPLERTDGKRTPLFDGEPTREQTRQGRLGDCGIVATLGAVAGHRPEAIRDCVQETGDGSYQVRMHEATFSASRMRYEPTGRPITLTVTPELPVYDKAPGKPAFADSTSTGAAWAPVLEKAVAGLDQTWSDERRDKSTKLWNARGNPGDAPTGYVRLNQGSTAGERAELLTQLTGRPAKTVEFPTGYDSKGRSADRQLLDEIRGQLAKRNPVLVGTRSQQENEPPMIKNLKPTHAYEVTNIDDRGRLHLRNPWNRRHPVPLTIGEFRANLRPRYTTLESP